MAWREGVEALLVLGTSVHVAYALLQEQQPDGLADSLMVLALSAMALLQQLHSSHHRLRCKYATRTADSDGVELGAVTLPWTFAGLLASLQRQQHPAGFAAFALRSTVAASAAMLAMLHFTAMPAANSKASASHFASTLESSGKTNGRHSMANGSQPASQQHSLQQQCNGIHATASETRSRRLPGAFSILRQQCILVLLFLLFLFALYSHSGHRQASATIEASWQHGTCSVLLVAGAATAGMHLLLTRLPRCFTIGEAMVTAEAVAVLGYDAAWVQARQRPLASSSSAWIEPLQAGAFVEVLVCAVLLGALALAPLLHSIAMLSQRQPQHQPLLSTHQVLLLGALALGALALVGPATAALSFAFATQRRVLMLLYWVGLLAAVLPALHWVSARKHLPTIIVRKGYHLLAVALFAPALVAEPALLQLSLGIALALMVAAEVFRLGRLPLVGAQLQRFMMSFTDARDSGIILVSHFSLLTGCAGPVWLAALHDGGSGSAEAGGKVPLAAFAGIMALGVADAAASAVGIRFGRHRIFAGSKKTYEGTLGGIACTMVAWLLLAAVCGGQLLLSGISPAAAGETPAGTKPYMPWVVLLGATAASCVMEAVTTQLDNIFIPLHYFALLAASPSL